VSNEDKNNNGSTVLAKLLNQLNLPTLAMILLMGGGNLFQGAQSSQENHREIDRAIQEVHQLYEKLDETERRQLKALANQQEILEALRARQK
jgi:ABC-type phosphate transport system auxiliary subunit